MMTQLGRVVYDRKLKPFTRKDCGRILASLMDQGNTVDEVEAALEVFYHAMERRKWGWSKRLDFWLQFVIDLGSVRSKLRKKKRQE